MNKEIEISGEEYNLTKNYSYNSTSIKLSESKTINGNGYSLNAKNSEYLFEVSNDTNNLTFVFSDITFKNLNNLFNNDSHNIYLIDCNFVNEDANVSEYKISLRGLEDMIPGYCDAPSDKIVSKAKALVKKLTGLDAAKKLANWVKRYIHHESKAGFYQSPDTTLKRGVGNCACQTLLFLQMCEAVGITENHEVYFVHIGVMKFRDRHFFCVIDNICIDVDGRSDYAWGFSSAYEMPVYNMTKYPLLPLAKNY